jgi:hypothetical protein
MAQESKQTCTFLASFSSSRLRLRPGTDRGDVRHGLARLGAVFERLTDGDTEPEDDGEDDKADRPTNNRAAAPTAAYSGLEP